jgi:hypothetical protein
MKCRARESLSSSLRHWSMTFRSDIAAMIKTITLVNAVLLRVPWYVKLVDPIRAATPHHSPSATVRQWILEVHIWHIRT